MILSVFLGFCRVDFDPQKDWASTHFFDGTQVGATAHYTPEYRSLAKRCGYAFNVHSYMIEHEVAHSFVAEHIYGEPSRVLWALAHGKVASKQDILHEEELAISLQAFTRANNLPGSSAPGFSWFKLRDDFRQLMEPSYGYSHL